MGRVKIRPTFNHHPKSTSGVYFPTRDQIRGLGHWFSSEEIKCFGDVDTSLSPSLPPINEANFQAWWSPSGSEALPGNFNTCRKRRSRLPLLQSFEGTGGPKGVKIVHYSSDSKYFGSVMKDTRGSSFSSPGSCNSLKGNSTQDSNVLTGVKSSSDLLR